MNNNNYSFIYAFGIYNIIIYIMLNNSNSNKNPEVDVQKLISLMQNGIKQNKPRCRSNQCCCEPEDLFDFDKY